MCQDAGFRLYAPEIAQEDFFPAQLDSCIFFLNRASLLLAGAGKMLALLELTQVDYRCMIAKNCGEDRMSGVAYGEAYSCS